MTDKTLATIRPYESPFYAERVWDLTEFEDWERELLAAVKLGAVHALEDELTSLEADDEDQRKPRNKTIAHGAFDLDGDILQESVKPIGDGKLAIKDSTRLREWRNWRSLRFHRFDQADTQHMLDESHNITEHILEDLRWAYLHADAQLAEPFQRREMPQTKYEWVLWGES